MKKKHFYLLIVTCLMFNIIHLNTRAQIPVQITPPVDTAGVCRNNLFFAEFNLTSSATISIQASMLNVPNGGVGTCGSIPIAPHVFIRLNIDSTSHPVSNIQTDTLSGSWTGTISDTGTIRLAYHIYIDCSVIPSTGSSQNINLQQIWKDPSLSNTFVLNNGNDTLVTPNIRTHFMLQLPLTTDSIGYLQTFTKRFMYKNTQLNSMAHVQFKFVPDSTEHCGQITHLGFSYRLGVNGVPDTLIPGTWTSVSIQGFDILIIDQLTRVDTCLLSCSSSQAQIFWRCDSGLTGPNVFCTDCQDPPPSPVNILNPFPYSYHVERISPVNAAYDSSCYNDTTGMTLWEYRFTNGGQGALDSLFIDLDGRNHSSALNHLTLVPISSLEFLTTCVACTVNATITPLAQSLCSTMVPDPLSIASYVIKDFNINDTIIVRFKTFRCSEQVDSILLNTEKYYNQWTLASSAKDLCGNNVKLTGAPFFGTASAISSNFQNGGADINQELVFTPTVTDLSVPPDTAFGDNAHMEVELKRLVQTPVPPFDYQLLGHTGGASIKLKGFIRATIHCEQGLRLENPENNALLRRLNQNTGLLDTLFPVYYHTQVSDMVCESGDYFYYFNLADSLSVNFWTQGSFVFTLQACCTAIPDGVDFDVRFHLMANPDSCFSMDFSDTTHTIPPLCSGMGCDWLPLSSENGSINVHCPGCKAFGIIVDKYSMRRVSYGLQDSDNDGRADTGMIAITDTSAWFQARQQALKLHYSSYGDLLEDYLTAHFQDGDSTTGGYAYQQVVNLGVVMPYLQLARGITLAFDTMKLVPTSVTLYIDTPNPVQPNCIDCADFQANTSALRTQHIIHADGNDVYRYLDTLTSGNLFLFTFKTMDSSGVYVGNLHDTAFVSYRDTVSPFSEFTTGQIYRLKVGYRVCSNFMPEPDDEYQISNLRKISAIGNNMWLSGAGYPKTTYNSFGQMLNTVTELDSAGWTLDPLNTDSALTLVNDSFASSYRFYCETFGGLHYFFAQDGRNHSEIVNSQGCSKAINVLAACRTAGGSTPQTINIYPFEFRPPALWPEHYTITVPPGYRITGSRVRNEFGVSGMNRFNNWRTFTAPIDTGTFSMADTLLPGSVCLQQNVTIPITPTDTNFYLGSRYSARRLQFTIEPDSCGDNIIFPLDSMALVRFNGYISPCTPNPSCPPDSSFALPMDVGGGKPLAILPNLDVQTALASNIISTHRICVDVLINNQPTTFYPPDNINSTAAGFVFIALPDTVANSFLTNWMFVSNAGDTVFPTNGQIIPLDTSLSIGGNITGKLCCDYISCQDSAQVSFHVGWNCEGFPVAPFDTALVCGSFQHQFEFTDAPFVVSTEGKSQSAPEYSLCDPFTIHAPFSSTSSGSIYPQVIHLDTIPAGIQVLSVVLQNCLTMVSDTLIVDSLNPLIYPITINHLQNIGFTTGAIDSGGCVKADITLLPGCGFKGELLPSIILEWINFCGYRDTTLADFEPGFSWDGTSQCTDCFTIEKTALQNTVFVGDTATFQIVVCGTNAMSQTLLFSDQLPVNFTPVSMMPDSITVPAIGCDTLFVFGIYSQPGSCSDQAMWNTATVYFTGDSLFSQACAEVYPICAANITAPPIPDSSFTSSFPSTVSNHTLFLEGRLYVDNILTLNNCSIFVNIGGQIITLPGGSLILDSTIIQGCDYMWRGMVADTLSSVAVTNGSTIRDADKGIEARDGSTLKITYSSFEDNVRSIYVPDNPNGNNIVQTIYGNRFGLFAPSLKPAYPGQAPFGSVPYAGIEVNDVVMTIGNADADSNWFYNMNIGVIGHRSALKVVNNKFTMVQTDTATTTPDAWDGAAVASLGNQSGGIAGKLTVRAVSSGAWSIEDCQTGVYTDYSQLDVKSVDMTGMQTGVASRHCTDMLTSQVDGCKIEARQFGIDWRLNAGSGGMRATGNFIYNSGGNSVGIWMREANLSGEPIYQISGNYVEVVDGLAGISGMRLYGTDINWNVVRLTGTPAVDMHGIGVQANDSSLISCNVVAGDDDGDTLKTAYLVNISDRTQVTCNTADSTGKGYAFGGIAPSLFKGNVMKQHFVGLYLNNVAVIDTQTHAGNRWVGSYGSGYGAVNLNAASFTELAKSLFIVDPGMGSAYTPVTPPNDTLPPFYVDNIGWFDPVPGNSFDCGAANYCITSLASGGSDELRMSIVSDDTLTVEYIPESKTMARQYLYEELKTDSILLGSKTEYQSFVSNHENQNIGYLYDVKKSLADVFRLNQTEKQGLASIDSLIKFYTDSILITDSLARADTATSYTSLRSILSAQLKLQIILRADLVQSRWVNGTALLTTAQFKNNLISGGDDPVSNEKMVNTISMQYQLNGINGMVTYYSTLLGIANQCPFKGGKAVYRARALVSLITDSITYDDQSTCLTEGIYRSQSLNQKSTYIPISIRPNPANDKVDIILHGNFEGVCSFQIVNAIGSVAIRSEFDCSKKKQPLDISMLAPGTYIIKASISKEFNVHQKLVIIR